MGAPIEFWFDFSSPYGFLASTKIDTLAARHGRTVDWRVTLLGVVFKSIGTTPLVEIPLKGDYSRRDFVRSAEFHGVAGFRMPARFPIPTQAPARIFLWAKSRDPALGRRVARALLDAYWVHGQDLSDADLAAGVAATAGVDRLEARAVVDDPVWKDALKREVEAGIARGVFGSPFVIADGEPFWGLDRVDQLEWRLSQRAPATGAVRSVSHLRLIVPDPGLAAAIAFYRDVLALPLAVDVPGVYAEFATAGARLALCAEPVMSSVVGRVGPRDGDAVVVCLAVDDVDAACAAASARGARVVREPHDQPTWMQRVAHLRDPAGNLVELWTRLPVAPARG